MMVVAPWRDVPPPNETIAVRGAWEMARVGSSQHPAAVRALWQDDKMVAVGGVVQIAQGEGFAFYYAPDGLPRFGWRLIWNTVHSIVWWAHERGLRVVTAMVRASHLQGHRLIRRMGFEPFGWAPHFAGETAPMLRYLHCWPAIEEPALVRHQRHEQWRAELGAWCPRYLEEIS